jgi:hypothetical protein
MHSEVFSLCSTTIFIVKGPTGPELLNRPKFAEIDQDILNLGTF